jgi:hypothetical protein
MKKYKLKCYGWEMEALCHSINSEQVEHINDFMELSESDDLSDMLYDLENIDIDIYSPNLFHIGKPFNNNTMRFVITDENDDDVISFGTNEVKEIYDMIPDFDDKFEYTSYVAYPGEFSNENVLLVVNESKGGLYSFEFESDTIPTPLDFAFSSGEIETPEGDYDFIDKIFFKSKELEILDNLDNTCKAVTVNLWTLKDC